MRLICKLFDHKWSDFQYFQDNDCTQKKKCQRCGDIKENTWLVKHDWKSWEPSLDNRCEETRYCNRCNEKETRVVHSWDENGWKLDSINNCIHSRKCLNNDCNEVQVKEYHNWAEWNIGHSCSTRKCKDCSKVDECKHTNIKQLEIEEIESFAFPTTVFRIKYDYCPTCGYENEISKEGGFPPS